MENEGTKLTIQSVENHDGVVVVKVSVPPKANKEEIYNEFIKNYENYNSMIKFFDLDVSPA